MIGTIITNIIKPVIACGMSVSMAINATLSGPAGSYALLQNKAMETNPAKNETQINLMLDLEAISTLAGTDLGLDDIENIPGIYADGKIDISATLYTFEDFDNTKLAVSLGEDLADGYAVYIDDNGLAVTPKLVDSLCEFAAAFDEESARKYSIYRKYFADNGVYMSWNDLFNVEEGEYSQELSLVAEVVKDVAEVLGNEENAKALAEIYAPMLDPVEKYYSESTVDGVKGYTAKLNGIQLIEYSEEIYGYMYSEETANKIFDYLIGLIDDIDLAKYVDIAMNVYGDIEIPAGLTNEQLVLLVQSYAEGLRADFVAGYTSIDGEAIADILDVLVTGKDENDVVDDDTEKLFTVIRPYFENSFFEATISEKDSVIKESVKLSVSDGKTTYGELEVITGTSKFDGTLPNTADVVPFDKRVESEEIDNKMGFEDAVEKGVSSIEIMWCSEMTPESDELYITSPYFYVNYRTTLLESVKNDPSFALMDEETQALILGMYEESDYECKFCESSAELIDSSVYLPLRQLMENAGYEVSWDAEARKAYVTVDGQKIEMTGVIVNDRTYVKVRDFEKLGATVEYGEEFYRQEAYNDFRKFCTATITFNK